MNNRKKPKGELQKFLEGVNEIYKLYKENESWIDPIVKAIRDYSQQEILRKDNENPNYYIVENYVWGYPLAPEVYQRDPQLYMYYPAQWMVQQTIYPIKH
jgi:hypothetical protein